MRATVVRQLPDRSGGWATSDRAGAGLLANCSASVDGAYLEPALQIAFPPDRAELDVEDAGDGSGVIVKAGGGALPLTWLVDGVPISSDPMRREAELPAASRGFLKLSVIDAKGRADRVTIRLK